MTTETITFTPAAELKKGVFLLGKGFVTIFRALGGIINAIVHRWPWPVIIAILLVNVLISYICIGQARAERDHYNQENVQLHTMINSYKALDKEARP